LLQLGLFPIDSLRAMAGAAEDPMPQPQPQPQEPFTLTGFQGMDRATILAAPALADLSEFMSSVEMGNPEAERDFAHACNTKKMPCPACKGGGLVHAHGVMKPPRTSRTVRFMHSISQLRVLTCAAFPSAQHLCCGILFFALC
jgi:hypothetical protein